MDTDFELMKNVDIRTVDIETLQDIRDIKIDESASAEKRRQEFLSQIKNPYCFRCGDIAVKVEYKNDGPSLEECLKAHLKTMSF